MIILLFFSILSLTAISQNAEKKILCGDIRTKEC